ncbi:YIF1-domain-containing protein [Schizothecium vesticola]|uniref:Protein YIF1 n=1 Tax=Schizothecium vesticola TaxID=314040 RepID=A0AA40F1A3_9PEZI|nr:YIF1-domain-containing protein [Schizothecium vesticola]
MQRPTTYGQSPPLHHPVPQHVSTVPQLRSPPPPVGQSYDGSPYQPQPQQQQQQQQQQQHPGGGNMFGQYGNFMNDPTTQLASQLGQSAIRSGQEYLEQNILKGRFRGWELKPYFNVTNSYVVNKLFLVLFPWRHKPWSRKTAAGRDGWYLPPRDDVNSPDMYIPVMSFVTYIFLRTLIAGLRGEFEPELFGYTATMASIIMFLEILGLKLGCYLLSISNESQLLDLVAYSGYKFVGVIVTIGIAEIVNGGKGTGGWAGWMVFLYTFLANSLFLMRSLKYVLLPENNSDNRGPMQPMQTDTRAKRNQRTQFLFFYSYVVQLLLMWILTRP